MADKLKDLFEKAQRLRAEGNNADAIEVLKNLVALAPEELIFQHNLAAAMGDVGRFREAGDVSRSAMDKGLNRPETQLVYARAMVGVQDFDSAEATYRDLARANAHDAVVHRELAQLIWMRTGDSGKTLSALNDAIDNNQGTLALQILRAEIKGQIGDAEGRYDLLRDMLRTASDNSQIAYFTSRAALDCKDYPAALEIIARASSAAPDLDDITAVHVVALLANGEAKAAEAVAARLRMRQPANQYYIALQATAWRLLGDDRYNALFDYDALVYASPLLTPPGWPNLQAYLDDLAAALDKAHRYHTHPFFLSVRHGSQISSITQSDDPAMRAFAIALSGPAQAYVDRLSAGEDPLRARNQGGFKLLSGWSVRLRPNGFHVNHVHPDGWVSSACHIRPSVDDSAAPNAGWLKFGEPGCATDPPLGPEHFVKPEAGQMVFFPSYMWHGTAPFTKGPDRLTVAVDIGAKSA